MPEATRYIFVTSVNCAAYTPVEVNIMYFLEGCEEENDQPPPLEKVDGGSSALCEDEDLGGLGEALLKEIAEAVQVEMGLNYLHA